MDIVEQTKIKPIDLKFFDGYSTYILPHQPNSQIFSVLIHLWSDSPTEFEHPTLSAKLRDAFPIDKVLL